MVNITIRVENAADKPLSSVVYRLMRGADLTHIFLNDDSECYFFVDMDSDVFGDFLIRCSHECDR